MRHLRMFWFTALLLGCMTTMAQPVSSSKLQEGKVPEGTVYYLPKTVIHFHLLIEKKTYTPGIFCQYAEKYLRQKPAGQDEDIHHRVVDFRLSQTGVRDTSKCFIATLKGKSATSEIRLSEDGVLLAVNDTPIVVKKQPPFKATAKKKKNLDPMKFLSDEVRMAGSNAKKAELVALQMAELQEHRQQLITGEAEEMPTDKAQLQLMRISRRLGLVDKDDLSGIPFYLTLEDLHQQSQQQYDYPENKKDGGFYTNVPGFVRLTLYREDRQLATYEYPFAQFGFTELRGGSLFKKYPTHLKLNPITGAVEKLQAEIPEK